jgi:hypothetical protein
LTNKLIVWFRESWSRIKRHWKAKARAGIKISSPKEVAAAVAKGPIRTALTPEDKLIAVGYKQTRGVFLACRERVYIIIRSQAHPFPLVNSCSGVRITTMKECFELFSVVVTFLSPVNKAVMIQHRTLLYQNFSSVSVNKGIK